MLQKLRNIRNCGIESTAAAPEFADGRVFSDPIERATRA